MPDWSDQIWAIVSSDRDKEFDLETICRGLNIPDWRHDGAKIRGWGDKMVAQGRLRKRRDKERMNRILYSVNG